MTDEQSQLTFIAIGQNVWGHSKEGVYEAIKAAYSQGSYKNNRFYLYLVSDDWMVNEINGGVSASQLHRIGWFNNNGQALKHRI